MNKTTSSSCKSSTFILNERNDDHSQLRIVVPIVSVSSHKPESGICPFCYQSIITRIEKESGVIVWLSATGLAMLGMVFGCCLIPFFINGIKDTNHYCPNCNRLIGQKRRFSSKDFYSFIAVLIELRSTDRIVTVVQNVNQHIPNIWPIQIFHSKDNADFIKTSTLAPFISSGKIFLTQLDIIYDKNQFNRLLTNIDFWKQIPGEKILFFQIDSIMCSNSPHKITDYLQYDYIGAPWNPTWYPFNKTYLVGNGGFSLRSRSKTLALIQSVPYQLGTPEDMWYAQNLNRVNASIARVEVAKTFAVESIFYERPLGVHRFPWRCDFRRKLTLTCPEAVLVLPNGGC